MKNREDKSNNKYHYLSRHYIPSKTMYLIVQPNLRTRSPSVRSPKWTGRLTRVISKTRVWGLNKSFMLHPSELQNPLGVPNPLVSIWLDALLTEAGILDRLKNQMEIPPSENSVIHTPPPFDTNVEPYDLDDGSVIPQPEFELSS